MRARYVIELTEGARVDTSLVIRSKEMKAARNGDAYLSLSLSDRTGAIHAVYFRPDRAAASAPVGSVVQVQGTVTRFHGTKRISVESMTPAVTWDSSDFLPSGPRPIEELIAEFGTLIRSVEEKSLRALLMAVFADKLFFDRFSTCPASSDGCRAYLGGLIEHTIEVASVAREIARRHDVIDRDLLVAAALMHDIGRADELEFDVSIAVTDVGRLLGHVTLGLRRLHAAATGIRIDEGILARIEHALLVHHDDADGSTTPRPSTPEALVLARADQLDREAVALESALAGAIVAEEKWTGTGNPYGRSLFAATAVAEATTQVNGRPDRMSA